MFNELELSPEFQSVKQAYDQAKLRLDNKIRKHLDYRYDLPDGKVAKTDPDYDRLMCRNNVLTGFVGQVDLLLKIDAANFRVKDPVKVEEIQNLLTELVAMSKEPDTEHPTEHGTMLVRQKTAEDMRMIKASVEKLVALCDNLVESNNPAQIAVV